MKRCLALLLILCALPYAAFADPAVVQSGEHPRFTRLVTPINDSPWSVTQTGRKVTLSFEAFEDGFDTAQVFDLIPRDRVAELRAEQSSLTLTLDCDCAVSATTERGLYVVIDVADDKGGLQTPQSIVAATTPALDGSGTTPKLTATMPEFPETSTQDVAAAWNTNITSSANPEAVTALQERLSRELQTATDRGVLSPAAPPFPLASPTRSTIDTDAFGDLPPPRPPAATEGQELPERDLANLRISTSRDLPQTFRDLAEITNMEGQVCPVDSDVSLASWGDTRPFAAQVANARLGLFGEFDRVDPDVALRLARTYLYFGFGVEARNVLDLAPALAKDTAILIAIARILDGEPVPQNNALAGLAECHGEVALWATLVAPVPARGAMPPSTHALRTLNGLPSHLRVLVAPKLHRVLLAYGDPDGADAALRSLKRLPGTMSPAAKVALAQGALEKGQIDTATKRLTEVVDDNTQHSPEALIALVDTKLKAKQPIAPETAQLVEAYVQELRGTALGPDLLRVHILSLAQSGQFDAAYEQIKEADQIPDGLAPKILAKLTLFGSDIVFLDHALVQPDEALKGLSQNDALALADRFLTLGFASEAEHVLGLVAHLPRNEERQLLAARVSLAMGKPFRAQADLLNLQSDAANSLRADAKRMSGAHDEAHVLYTQINRPQDAAETAWLAEDWRNLTTQETPTFGPATTLTPGAETAPNDPSPSSAGMLARSASLLDQSTQARQTLQDLLSAEDLQIPQLSE